MAAELSEAQVLARALIQAAQSAADAVQQLQAAQAQSSAGGGAGASQRGAAAKNGADARSVRGWHRTGGIQPMARFVLNLKAWLNAADSSFERSGSPEHADLWAEVGMLSATDPSRQ